MATSPSAPAAKSRFSIFRVLAGFLAVLFVLLLAAPWLFRDRIETAIKTEANRQLDAELDWGSWGFSLIRSFPNISVRVDDVTVHNKAPFDSVTLADIGHFRLTLDIRSLWGDQLIVRSLELNDPVIDVRVLPDGSANYNITRSSGEAPSAVAEPVAFALALQAYQITNASITYTDEAEGMVLRVLGLEHSGKGDFTQDAFTLATSTHAASLDVAQSGTRYLREAELDLQADLDVNLTEGSYTLRDNELRLNALRLLLDGRVAAIPAAEGESGYDMDLTWSSSDNDVAGLLSLVPAAFAGDLVGVKTGGTADFSGAIKGRYAAGKLPGIILDAAVSKGRFQFPDMPGSAEKLEMTLHLEQAAGSGQQPLLVDLKRLTGEWAGQPFDVRLRADDALGRAVLDGAVDARLNLASVAKVVPMPATQMEGRLIADLQVKGALDDLEKGRYSRVEAGGKLTLNDLVYQSAELPHPVHIDRMAAAFTPQHWRLDQLEGRLGSSAISATGTLDNLLSWWFRDSTLTGAINLRSAKLDLNEWLVPAESGAGGTANTKTDKAADAPVGPSPAAVLAIPAGLRFAVKANLDEVLYENLTLRGVTADATIADQRAIINTLRFSVLGGTVALNGSLDTRQVDNPGFALTYDVRDLDIQPTAEAVETVNQLAPIARFCEGRFRTQLTLSGRLDRNLEPEMSSLNGRGKLSSPAVTVRGFEPLEEAGRVLRLEQLKAPSVKDLNLTYVIRDGRVVSEPFDLQIDQFTGKVAGSMGIEQQDLAYTVDLAIPTAAFGGGAQQTVGGLLGLSGSALSGFALPKDIKATLGVGGTVNKPSIKPVFAGGGTNLVDAVKEQVVETVKEEVGQQIDAAREAAIAKAEAERDRLIAEAQTQADKLKATARTESGKAKDAAYAVADAELAKIKNPLAKKAAEIGANKAKQTADKKEQEALAEADRRADELVDVARKKGDDVVRQAEQASYVKP